MHLRGYCICRMTLIVICYHCYQTHYYAFIEIYKCSARFAFSYNNNNNNNNSNNGLFHICSAMAGFNR